MRQHQRGRAAVGRPAEGDAGRGEPEDRAAEVGHDVAAERGADGRLAAGRRGRRDDAGLARQHAATQADAERDDHARVDLARGDGRLAVGVAGEGAGVEPPAGRVGGREADGRRLDAAAGQDDEAVVDRGRGIADAGEGGQRRGGGLLQDDDAAASGRRPRGAARRRPAAGRGRRPLRAAAPRRASRRRSLGTPPPSSQCSAAVAGEPPGSASTAAALAPPVRCRGVTGDGTRDAAPGPNGRRSAAAAGSSAPGAVAPAAGAERRGGVGGPGRLGGRRIGRVDATDQQREHGRRDDAADDEDREAVAGGGTFAHPSRIGAALLPR